MKFTKRILATALTITALAPTQALAWMPSGRYVVGSSTVTDTITNLEWQKTPPAGSYTWADALGYCKNLTLDSHSDWRLPNVRELASIITNSGNPSIDQAAFGSVSYVNFWTSTPRAGMNSAWAIHMNGGSISHPGYSTMSSARCVRD